MLLLTVVVAAAISSGLRPLTSLAEDQAIMRRSKFGSVNWLHLVSIRLIGGNNEHVRKAKHRSNGIAESREDRRPPPSLEIFPGRISLDA